MSPLYNPYVPAQPAQNQPEQAPASVPLPPPTTTAFQRKQHQKKLESMTLQQMLQHSNPKIRQAAKRAQKLQTAINTVSTATSQGISTKEFLAKNPEINATLRDAGITFTSTTPTQVASQEPFWTRTEFKEIVTETQKYVTEQRRIEDKTFWTPFEKKEMKSEYLKSLPPVQEQIKQVSKNMNVAVPERGPILGSTAAMVAAASQPAALKTVVADAAATTMPEAKTVIIPQLNKQGAVEVDSLGNPVYVPFETDKPEVNFFNYTKSQEWKDYKAAVEAQHLPGWKEKMQLGTFWFFQNVAKRAGETATKLFSWQKERITQGDNLTIEGTALNAIFNTLVFTYASASDMYYTVLNDKTWEQEKLRNQNHLQALLNSGVKETDQRVLMLRKQIEADDVNIIKAQNHEDYFYSTQAAMRKSWENFQTAKKTDRDFFATISNQLTPEYQKYIADTKRDQLAAAEVARQLRPQAYNLAAQANSLVNTRPEESFKLYNQAVKTMMDAQKADAESDPADPTWSYTWIQEPGREKIFRETMASTEIQLGRPLSTAEIRRLKMYYENTWTEFWGESIFDITNFIPEKLMEGIFAPLSGKFWDEAAMSAVEGLRTTSKGLETAKWAKTAAGIEKIASGVEKTRSVTTKIAENFPVISYLRRQTVSSVASKRQNSVYYLFSRISGSYRTTEDFLQSMEHIAGIVNQIRLIPEEEAARVAFQQAQDVNKGLQAITFDEFKRFFDVVNIEDGGIEFTKWAEMYREAAKESEPEIRRMTEQALRATGNFTDETALMSEVNRQVAEALNSPLANGWTLGNFSEKFAGAYTDAHRLYKGSILYDDSISGQMALFFRKLADDTTQDSQVRKIFKEVTDKWASGSKLTLSETIDHLIAAGAAGRNAAAKKTAMFMAERIEGMVKIGKFFVDGWAMFVLSLNPRWVVQNYIDSSVRAWIAGSNPIDSAATMVLSLHRQLVDELGFLPIELGQSLARDGLNFSTSVTGRLVYGDWKPLPGPLGIISYFQYEVDRLKALRNISIEEASVEAAKALSQRFPEGSIMRKLTNMWGGVKFYGQALSGAAQDFNTSIEFTLRLRLFHKEYFNNLRQLDRVLNETGLEILDPQIRGLASQIWKSSESNPRKLSALVESILRKSGADDPAAWSSILPPNLNKVMGALTDSERSVLISDIRNQLDVLVTDLYKNGQKPTSADFVKFFDDYAEDFKNTVNIQLSNFQKTKEISGQIGNQTSKVPDIMEAAIGPSAVDREKINAAVERIGKNVKGRFNPTKSFDDFKVAMSDLAPIEVVPGSERHIFVSQDGSLRVTVGQELINNRSRAEINDLMHEVAIKSFVQHESDFAVAAGFRDSDEFEKMFRLFLTEEGPAKALAQDPAKFLTIVEEFETNPTLHRILERTKGKAIPYEATYKLYMNNLPIEKLHGQAWFDMLEARADRIHVPPAHVRHAAIRQAQETKNLQELVNSGKLGKELEQEVRNFLGMYDQARKDLGQFYLWSEPGPKQFSGDARSMAWDEFYWRQAEAYDSGRNLKASIIQKINTNPDEALTYLKQFNSDFYTNFLPEHGISEFSVLETAPKVVNPAQPEGAFAATQQFAENRPPITQFKMTKNGKTFSIQSPYIRKDLYERFLSPERKAAIMTTERFDLSSVAEEIPLHNQLFNAVHDSFKLTNEQATMYSRIIEDHIARMVEETGQPSEYFLQKMGFLRVEGALRAPDALRQVKAVLDNEGRHLLYGFGAKNSTDLIRQTSVMFYDDLKTMMQYSDQATDDFLRLKDFLEKQSGKKMVEGKMADEHLQLFADTFQKYVLYGDAPNSKLKKPFERYAKWMNTVTGNALDKTILTDLPEDVVQVMDRMFTATKTQTPEAANRTMRIMAKNAGVEFKGRGELLNIVNETIAPIKKADKVFLKESIMATQSMTEEQTDAIVTLLEHRARAWGALNGKDPAEYIKNIRISTNLKDMEAALKKVFDGLPTTADRRRPAFEQLRNLWDTLDDEGRKEAFMWLTERTLTDPLSGVETLVAKALDQKPTGWIEATSDLNALTAINNTWGHGAGDTLIAGIGAIANEETSRVGGRVFRVGGDEFTYWFPDEESAKQAMDAIDKRVFGSTFTVGGEPRTGFSVSYGIAPDHELADKALYEDKLRRVAEGQRPAIRDTMPETVRIQRTLELIDALPYQPLSPELLAKRIEPVNRSLSRAELEAYARALSRSDVGNVVAALRGESVRANRLALINMIHEINPKLAEEVAINNLDILFKEGATLNSFLGGFTFTDTKKAIGIFNGADFATLPHELGHMFRTELPETDLRIIEKATGLSEGEFVSLRPRFIEYNKVLEGNLPEAAAKLGRDEYNVYFKALQTDAARFEKAEEMFADGFVKYLKSGKAPVPELQTVFDKFKAWLRELWNSLKGNADFSLKIDADVRGVYDRLFQVPFGETVPPLRYSSLGDVPHDLAARAFKSRASDQIVENMDAAFNVWKLRYDMKGIPEPALKNFNTAKAFVKEQFMNTTGDLANQYRILQWRFEQFEDTMIENMTKQGFLSRVEKTVDDFFAPALTEAHMDDGVRTFMRSGVHNRTIYEQMMAGLEEWKKFLSEAADSGTPFPVLTKDEAASLTSWAKGATERKAKLMDLAINGGKYEGISVEGALPKTNRYMLDYQDRNNFDQLMKNVFPFWMFPSRSLPFWTKTLATHPRIIMLYQKMRKMSEAERYQAGAVTSTGKPLPSLENYIPIPGLDMWINPTAPLSFRYLLDIQSYGDDLFYKARTAQEGDDSAYSFIAKQFMETSPIFGFSPGPWIQFAAQQLGVPTQQWSLIPQTNLIPPWWLPEFIQNSEKLMNWMAPEPKWHDFLIERDMLETAMQYVNDPKLTDLQKKAYLGKVSQAIAEKGTNPMWMEAYKAYVTDEKKKNVFAFFTGFYPKQFSDSQADLLQARNEYIIRASAMNNSFQANLLQIPMDEQMRWDDYRRSYRVDTPLGWLYHLYGDIGWVEDDAGRLVDDPSQRAKLVAQNIEEDNMARSYFQGAQDLERWKNENLAALPVGANFDQTSQILDTYYTKLNALEEQLMPPYKYFGTNKPVSLIQNDIRNYWWKKVSSSRPAWLPNETYESYKERMAIWERNFPLYTKTFAKNFIRSPQIRSYMENLDVDQPLDLTKLVDSLIKETSVAGYNAWKLENDDIFTAMNTVWKENYWDKYWDAVGSFKNEQRDLLEMRFFKENPPPDVQKIYQWVVAKYGPDRFSMGDIQQWVMYDPDKELQIYNIDDRHLQDVGETEVTREKIWRILSWAGPGKQRNVLENAFVDNGGNPDDLNRWYSAPHGQAWDDDPAHVASFYEQLQAAATGINLSSPNRPQLEQFLRARQENDILNQVLKEDLGAQYQDVVNLYFFKSDNLSKGDFRKWKAQNRDVVKLVDKYFYDRKVFANSHKLWASYYTWTPKPSISNMGAGESGTLYNPATSRIDIGKLANNNEAPISNPTPQDVKADKIMQNAQATQSQPPLLFSFGPVWPTGMKAKISPSLYSEVEAAYRGYGKLSNPARKYLQSLYNYHPEWRKFISEILNIK